MSFAIGSGMAQLPHGHSWLLSIYLERSLTVISFAGKVREDCSINTSHPRGVNILQRGE